MEQDDQKIDEQLKKHMEDLSRDIRAIIDPMYKKLCELSEKINNTNTSGVEISTPTGTFYWKPKPYERRIN